MNLVKYKKLFFWLGLCIIVGLLSGTASAFFLMSLDWITRFRELQPQIIFALPLAGLLIGWVFHVYGKEILGGSHLIIEEIHDPKKTVPLRMAPFVFMGTLITHLFGGSAGREGAAVQIAASLSDQVSSIFKLNKIERRTLLIAGMGAGFSAATGAPLAGIIFGMEVLYLGRWKAWAVFESILASTVAYYTAILWGAPHSVYASIRINSYEMSHFFWIIAASVFFGGAVRLFIFLTHGIDKLFGNLIKYPPFRPFVGGLLLIFFYYIEGSYKYAGLGIETIRDSLSHKMSYAVPLFKIFFTSLTVGTGYKGGEFVPLVFVGSTLGSWLSHFLPISLEILASVGFVSVFGAASKTPLACSIMCIELFGWEIAPYAVCSCWASYIFSGRKSLFKNQRQLSINAERL